MDTVILSPDSAVMRPSIYTLGISDQSIFPEVELDKIKRNIGFDVTIVTTARTDEEAKSLLSEMGMPFSDRARKPAAQPTP